MTAIDGVTPLNAANTPFKGTDSRYGDYTFDEAKLYIINNGSPGKLKLPVAAGMRDQVGPFHDMADFTTCVDVGFAEFVVPPVFSSFISESKIDVTVALTSHDQSAVKGFTVEIQIMNLNIEWRYLATMLVDY
jgi:hypothetical protein